MSEPLEILIVEDSATQASLLRIVLEHHGFTVRVASDGKQGLDAVAQRAPALVLSDIVMPVMDGYEMCETLKRETATRDVPVILLTHLSEPEDIVHGLQSGADGFILKPYDQAQLVSRIQDVLARHAMRRGAGLEAGIKLRFAGGTHLIEADRLQILELLLATFESAMERTRALQQAQSRLKAANEQLAEKSRNLEKAKEIAEVAAQAKGQFLANMSHELRTPLNAVTGLTSLLFDSFLSADQRDWVESIRASSDALLAIIDNILAYSRLESGDVQLDERPFDLRGCVESCLEQVAPSAAEKGLELACSIEPEVPVTLVGDGGRVREVLGHLVGNAVKFTHAGEVLVSATSRDLGDGSHEVHFCVRDTGIGIPADRLDRLFKSFSQIDASATRAFGGTGLGLAISKRLCERMGSKLWVESQVALGSSFHFTLAAAAQPTERPAFERGAAPALAGKRLLLVESNTTTRRLLVRQTEMWGMPTWAAASADEALGFIRKGQTFDVALVNLSRDSVESKELVARLRAECGAGVPPPIVGLSSSGSAGRFAGETAGAEPAAVLCKPVKPAQLFDVLVGIFDGRGAPTRHLAGVSRIDRGLAARLPLDILLVEDNPMNQKVALRILERMGYKADVAVNGERALDALGKKSYDVVLMDIQMPVMDGLEASRRICRQWPRESRPGLIAMTANAMHGDREECLAAGMDDYIRKPVQIEHLTASLERWGKSRRREAAPESEAPGATTSTATLPLAPSAPPHAAAAAAAAATGDLEILDRTVLAGLRELQIEGEPDIVEELVGLFVSDTPARVEEMKQALAAGDAKTLSRAAHSLKGNSASIGARLMASICAQVEKIGRGGTTRGAEALLPHVNREFERVRQAIESERQTAT